MENEQKITNPRGADIINASEDDAITKSVKRAFTILVIGLGIGLFYYIKKTKKQ